MEHKNSQSASYAAAGVDITAGYKAVELMKKHVARTRNEGCLDDVGGFGGCFGLPVAGMEEPVLVSGTDGVGTKLRIAQLLDKHDTIGIDCVAMCVNDVICCGARPLFFLDYIACGKNVPERIAEIVGGVAEGCVQSGSALIGGETAEHPGMMPVDDYDLAGFSVGIVDKKKIIDNSRMKVGDKVIALASTGVHSNGFSLVRKVFDVEHNPDLKNPCEALGGKSVLETLLTPTKIYVKSILALLEQVRHLAARRALYGHRGRFDQPRGHRHRPRGLHDAGRRRQGGHRHHLGVQQVPRQLRCREPRQRQHDDLSALVLPLGQRGRLCCPGAGRRHYRHDRCEQRPAPAFRDHRKRQDRQPAQLPHQLHQGLVSA